MLRVAVAGSACLCLLVPRFDRGRVSPVPPQQASSIIEHDSRQVGSDDLVLIIAYQQ